MDDLIITSTDRDMITDLKSFLRNRYGEITSSDGPVLNYLGMVFDMSVLGEARVTMKGYVEDVITYAGAIGTNARSPATDGLFETREDALPAVETERAWFHSVVAKLA